MLGLEGSSSGVVWIFMLGLGKESEKKYLVDVVVKLEVDGGDREGSVYFGFFLWILGSGVLVSDGVVVACWGRNVSFHFKGRMMSWSVLVGTGVRGVGYSRDCCGCGARRVGDCGDCRSGGGGGDLLSEDDDGVEGQLGT